jgi:pyruvate/2-oxoglutarate dehydrogenase complex dihydrolipoamide dehydrogenase (E3) component
MGQLGVSLSLPPMMQVFRGKSLVGIWLILFAGDAITEEYDTVVLAIGRDALTDDLNLASVGVQTNKE